MHITIILVSERQAISESQASLSFILNLSLLKNRPGRRYALFAKVAFANLVSWIAIGLRVPTQISVRI